MKKKLLIAIFILLLIPVTIYFAFPEFLYNYSITSIRKAAGLSKKVMEVDKYFIHYLEGGQGETILLLHGFGADKDRVIHISSTDIIKKRLPGSTIVVLKNCGHLPMLERPEETAKYYVDFLNKI